MTYGVKLFVLLACLIIFSNGLVAGANYLQCRSLLQSEIHRKSRAIAASTAALLDTQQVKSIKQRGDETTPAYRTLQNELRRVRDLNRNKDTWIDRIFILMPAS